MRKIAAELRHRELTQEIYNIGDEVAQYIENLIEAIEAWDHDLAMDCLAELGDIIEDARVDSGRCVRDLIGLRHALLSVLRSGTMSAAAPCQHDVDPPHVFDAHTLTADYPIDGPPVAVHQLAAALQDRTAATADYLRDVVEYVLDQTDAVARNLDMISLPQLYNRTGQQVSAAYHGWYRTVVESHFAYVRTMRGHNPPAFLEERARIDRIVAKVAAKRAAAKRSATTA